MIVRAPYASRASSSAVNRLLPVSFERNTASTITSRKARPVASRRCRGVRSSACGGASETGGRMFSRTGGNQRRRSLPRMRPKRLNCSPSMQIGTTNARDLSATIAAPS